MLTMDARKRSTSFQFANGMVNVGWVAGWLERGPDRKHLIVHQGSKKEFGIPIEIRDGETIRPGYKDGSPIKVTCRISGQFLRDKGERIVVLRMLDMDNPTVLDMQPYERRKGKSNGEAAPETAADDGASTPAPAAGANGANGAKPHRVLLANGIKARLSGSANFFRIAGYVSGVAVEPGRMREDGRPGEPCLVILLRQDDNPDNAIPVRCYHRLAEAIADKLPIGIPIIINDGEVKIRVVPTGEPAGPDGVVPTHRYPFIKARVPKIASTDHIQVQPRWAEEMLEEYRKTKHRHVVKAAAAQANGNGSNGHGAAEAVAADVAAVTGEAAAAKGPKGKASLSAIAPE